MVVMVVPASRAGAGEGHQRDGGAEIRRYLQRHHQRRGQVHEHQDGDIDPQRQGSTPKK